MWPWRCAVFKPRNERTLDEESVAAQRPLRQFDMQYDISQWMRGGATSIDIGIRVGHDQPGRSDGGRRVQ